MGGYVREKRVGFTLEVLCEGKQYSVMFGVLIIALVNITHIRCCIVEVKVMGCFYYQNIPYFDIKS